MICGALDEEIEHNYNWNFFVNLLDSALHGLSFSFVSTSTILPLYVSYLTRNPLLIGLVAAIAGSAYLVPQLLAANHVERLDRKKPLVVKAGFFIERVPILVMALSALLLVPVSHGLALLAFFVALLWHGLGEGVVVIAWRDMLAKLLPADRRGKFFGVSGFAEALTGVFGASLAAYILGQLSFPNSFVLLFFLAFAGLFFAWVFVALTREPARVSPKSRISNLAYLRQLPLVLERDSNFRSFIVSRIMFGLGRMGIGFFVVYSVARWRLSDSIAGELGVTLLATQMITSLVLGFLSDRCGHKLNLTIQLSAVVLSMLLAFWSPAAWWLFLAFGLLGIAEAAEPLSGQVIVFEFSKREEDRPTYIGLASTLFGIFAGISPIVGGWIVSRLGYGVLFLLSGGLCFVSLVVLLVAVRDPRWLRKPVG